MFTFRVFKKQEQILVLGGCFAEILATVERKYALIGAFASVSNTLYTAVSFAPVQGFIEKSRKLRDLYGASQILSYLSSKVIRQAQSMDGVTVISPNVDFSCGNMDIIQGVPNRILIEGKFSYNDASSALAKGWNEIIVACKSWVEEQLSNDFTFSEESWGRAWMKWKVNAWEVFWGAGDTIDQAMLDLETRKLRRDWTVPNWNGESSSLSGADAIAYPNIDSANNVGIKYNPGQERKEVRRFYEKLAAALENTRQQDEPKFLDPTEWLSIPELIKRLVTHHQVAKRIDEQRSLYAKSFREMLRIKDKECGEGEGGYWTGWFMGDGDNVGKHLQSLGTSNAISDFSCALRQWGKKFQTEFKLGRVVYAGGDDFFGVLYGTEEKPQREGAEAIDFLIELRRNWKSGNLGINLSVGFVWAGHRVPQRDVLQHCREAEKCAKNLGRDRVTIRVLFNNGQSIEWTTPWKYLEWLKDYRDRNGKTGADANWSHVYSDLAQLKAKHAIAPRSARKVSQNTDDAVALALFGLYFGEDNDELGEARKAELSSYRNTITGSEDTKSVIEWIEGMIQVGWQLCSNS
jgi:CRISPR-associated protein Cmr2